MAPCMALGEAAGTAAGLAVASASYGDPVDVGTVDPFELRDALLVAGAVLSR